MNSRISDNMGKALNRQMNRELYSAYLYLEMSSYFESANLKGFASWMRVQVQEEMIHAMKFYSYILQKGGKALMQDIEAPPHDWKNPEDVFARSLKHEQVVTSLINDLVNLAVTEKDHATNTFLQWFVNEQVEEESSFDEALQKLKLLGKDTGGGLFLLDRELAVRVFTPPATGIGSAAPAGA
ncbi:MAG: ferritin [Elusimicrobiota bacterium]